jgi:glyoxylate/hydroxypyruvate reductase
MRNNRRSGAWFRGHNEPIGAAPDLSDPAACGLVPVMPTLLFVSPTDDPADWVAALAAALPGLDIRIWPDTGDPEAVDYALAWKPPPGLLAGLPNLKAIFSLGAGVDALLDDPTLPAAVPLVRMVDRGLTEGMTEWVCAHALAWHRQAAAYREQQARHLWRQRDEKLARERRVGVLGLGALGSDAARMLAALRFDVAGWSRSPKAIAGVDCRHGEDGLAAVLARSELLVCLLPLTAATEGILNAGLFAQLPRGAHLINAARGRHLVEADLLAALDGGQLSGATLDVFAVEPLPAGHPFWSDARITVSPHVASLTHARTAAVHVVEGIRRAEAGLPLTEIVDRSRGY